jgi:hypothetical protein
MLPLETKQSGSKLLPYSDLREGGGRVFLEEVSKYHATGKGKGKFC